MGLTKFAAGRGAIDRGMTGIESAYTVALAGNPNVGKSTVFNALTGLHQHTGNWPGKTVTNAQGICRIGDDTIRLVDIPGTYSLMAHSAEEEVARDFICFERPDAVVVVCDATCLERNLNLVLQIIETGVRVLLCVNLMDEAQRKHIAINISALENRLGVPVVATTARKRRSLNTLLSRLQQLLHTPASASSAIITYPHAIERAVAAITPLLEDVDPSPRWLALRLLEDDPSLRNTLTSIIYQQPNKDAIMAAIASERARLNALGLNNDILQDQLVSTLVNTAHAIHRDTVHSTNIDGYSTRDHRIDRLLTGRIVGYPLMLLLLAGIFWLTIEGANIPSAWLSARLFWIQDRLTDLCTILHTPPWLHDMLVLGVYRTLAWVVSVMLPPMALFFPLFTLLEDVGYLPRIAYNLDHPFARCHACGKQALTMCMGFGCNAAGVVGCRIIDSPRERLLAILTNNFVPCNGRFPTLVTLLTIFFVGTGGGSSFYAAILLTGVIILGILTTLGVTKLLSSTVLRGTPSSFTLELPPYRRPQIGQVIVRSILDRTLFVLGRAAAVAAPAGLLLWCMANLTVGGQSLLTHCADFLTPLGELMGLDGVILIAFILGFPANEIVLPIILMGYLSQGSLTNINSLTALQEIFIANGWTPLTAVCTVLFSLFHWPCSTTLLTIRKETGSIKWTLLAAALPTAVGITACVTVTAIARLFS